MSKGCLGQSQGDGLIVFQCVWPPGFINRLGQCIVQKWNPLKTLIGFFRLGGVPPIHTKAPSQNSDPSCANSHVLEMVDQKLSLALGGIKDLRVGIRG